MPSLPNIHFILIEPQHPGNIGSVCRACKNLGISNIWLINPIEFRVEETYKLGWGSRDLIDSIRVSDTLEPVLRNMQVVIGTTHRRRHSHPPLWTPREIAEKVSALSTDIQVALLFGRENNGLNNEEINYCNYISTIPLAHPKPAINLAQAAMIYGYELWMTQAPKVYELDLATKAEEGVMMRKMREMVDTLPLKSKNGNQSFVDLFRRIWGRAQLEKRDIRLLIKLFELAIQK